MRLKSIVIEKDINFLLKGKEVTVPMFPGQSFVWKKPRSKSTVFRKSQYSNSFEPHGYTE